MHFPDFAQIFSRRTSATTEDKLDFSDALELLKEGYLVTREGWNGKGIFLYLVPGSTFEVNRAPLNEIFDEGTVVDYHPHIDMRTADGYHVPWLASQADLLATDWQVVDND